MLCASDSKYGTVLRTCPYEGGITVTMHAHRHEVLGYELHTGELAFKFEVESGGGDCPPFLTTYEGFPPPTRIFADPREDPIRAALRPRVFHSRGSPPWPFAGRWYHILYH